MKDTDREGRSQVAEAASSRATLRFEAVGKSFPGAGGRGAIAALDEITLDVPPQRFVALLGPSGCGKTTILRLADGLIQPDRGRVEVLGKPPRPGPDIGFVFQSFRLLPWATVAANVDFALADMGLGRAERDERVRQHLDLVGLGRFGTAYPGELSGGMKQRVALARALAPRPQVLLMDEPFASLDAQTRELMQLELMQIWTRNRPVVLFVTHSVDEAIVLADEIILLGPRPGRICERLAVDLERPRWTYDARSDPRYMELRKHLSQRMHELVFSDPASDFFGRDVRAEAASDRPF
jgi:NitT/TauT family transport system ATP-binding protein